MPIHFRCSHCGKKVKASEHRAGTKGPCPHCQKQLDVPATQEQTVTLDITLQPAPVKAPAPALSSEYFLFNCPTCKGTVSATKDECGQKTRCPGCGQKLLVPSPMIDETVVGEFLGAGDREKLNQMMLAVLPPLPEKPLPPIPDSPLDGLMQFFQTVHRPEEPLPPIPDSPPTPAPPVKEQKFCVECGAKILAKAIVCPSCGCGQPVRPGSNAAASNGGSNRIAAGLLAIFLGNLGIHKFIMGYPAEGAILLVLNLACFVSGCIIVVPFVGCLAISVIVLIEGILYLTKTDEEFNQMYVVNRRPWF